MQETYVALSGALAIERRMATIANNISNANTAGYRADHVTVAGIRANPDYAIMTGSTDSALRVDPPAPNFFDALYASLNRDAIDYSPGFTRETKVPSDVAIDGDGFFAVKTPQGERYTRAGNFAVSPDGILKTVDGYPVLGVGGQEIKTGGARFVIKPDGTVLDAKGAETGRIRIVAIPDKALLAKEGAGLFNVTRKNFQPQEADMKKTQLRQGWLEGSNVEVVDELVDMIQIERAYQSFQKIIQTSEETDGHLIAAAAGGQ